MAIGSEPEVGKNFTIWKDMSEQDRLDWWKYMNENWSPYLMNGYAVLVHDKNNRYYKPKD